jgi:hypothetical protein
VLFSPLPAKSELALAISRGSILRPIGEMSPRPFGASPKSNVKRSIVSAFFEDLEKEWCGESGYWRAPVFKGRMEESGWWSPWQLPLL